MNVYSIGSVNIASTLNTNANLWTFVSAERENQFANASFQIEVETAAVNFNPGPGLAKVGGDSESITEISPDYKPYMEEGCSVAAVCESSKVQDVDKFLSIAQDEMSDYEYVTYQNGASYGIIIFGTANATKTQFYTPLLESATGLVHLTLWD